MNNNETMQLTYFPDGTPIDPWFMDYTVPKETDPARRCVLQEHGILPEAFVQTKAIQELIDRISEAGGGTIVVSDGIFITGALYFKQGVNLEIAKNGVLRGSADITDYPLCETRIEGETCLYYPALINAIGLDACPSGRHSGCAAPGTRSAPTRTSSARASSTRRTAPT